MSTNHPSSEIFRSAWSLYDEVVQANYLFHREIHEVIRGCFNRYAQPGDYALLDLGCGNARFLSQTLVTCPPSRYVGVDLSSAALEQAGVALSFLPRVDWIEQDMIAAAEEMVLTGSRFDWVYSGFAVHHLPEDGKGRLFQALKSLLLPGGTFLLVDVVRDPGQSRDQYLEEYVKMVSEEWVRLDSCQRQQVLEHVTCHDYPETLETLQHLARDAGMGSFNPLGRFRQNRVIAFGRRG